jgi:hypothetical protein
MCMSRVRINAANNTIRAGDSSPFMFRVAIVRTFVNGHVYIKRHELMAVATFLHSSDTCPLPVVKFFGTLV